MIQKCKVSFCELGTMKSAQLTGHLSASDASISYALSAFGVNDTQIAALPASKKLSISVMAFVHKFNHSKKDTLLYHL